MGVMEVKVELPSVTNLPEDSVVNVFHFANSNFAAAITSALIDFYTAPYTGAAKSISNYMSPVLSRTALAAQIDCYDLADPEPRVVIGGGSFTLDAADIGTGVPSEVALCVSWTADPVAGVPAARLRGRNFLGPWNINTLDSAEPSRPITDLRSVIAEAAVALINAADPDAPLVVYSRATVPPVARAVTGGFVDNAWDTMRSRGEKTSARTTF